MHPLSSGGYGYSTPGMDTQQQSPGDVAGSPQDPSNGDQNGAGVGQPQYSDINQILDQILNITDQSLDEAQVRHNGKEP
jgi:hypothetical protein